MCLFQMLPLALFFNNTEHFNAKAQGQSMPKQLLEKMRIQEVNQRKSSQSQKGGHPETLRAVERTVSRVKLLKPRRKAALLSLNCFC